MSAPPEIAELPLHEPEPPRLRNRVAKVAAVLLLIVVVGLTGAWAAQRLADSAAGDRPVATLPVGEEVDVTVEPGSTARTIGALLVDSGVVADAGSFERAVRLQGVADELKAGDYTLVGGMSLDDIIEELVAGPPTPDTYRVTVIEGLRIEEMLASLAQQTPYTPRELAAPLLDGSVTSPYLPAEIPDGAPPLTAWEGLLFPATYDFVEDAPPEAIVGRLADEMTARVSAVDWSGLEARGLTPYDGIIIASLVEKEAKLEEDRPLIASVIVNRLDDGMLLQIDATVIYALGENPGRVLNRHLRIDSPWNTYRYRGLPPTPIGGVRGASLEAAANPAVTDFRYYVLIDENGAHGFSETLAEHEEKVAQARADGVLP